MKKNRWWGVKLAASCVLASLLGLGSTGEVHGAYVDCAMCHLDPAPGSGAKDYFDFFISPQRQHPTGMAYPPAHNPDYIRPTALTGDIVFFDRNGNGIADFDEVQLFGINGQVECASCHREHGEVSPPPQPNMYLRVTGDLLCLVCHKV
jgi:predicted CXXCH cytochrome family protein